MVAGGWLCTPLSECFFFHLMIGVWFFSFLFSFLPTFLPSFLLTFSIVKSLVNILYVSFSILDFLRYTFRTVVANLWYVHCFLLEDVNV